MVVFTSEAGYRVIVQTLDDRKSKAISFLLFAVLLPRYWGWPVSGVLAAFAVSLLFFPAKVRAFFPCCSNRLSISTHGPYVCLLSTKQFEQVFILVYTIARLHGTVISNHAPMFKELV